MTTTGAASGFGTLVFGTGAAPGKVSQSNRSFDIEFWQRQGSTAIFAAAWEMVVEAYQWKKKSDAELAFQRTVECLKSVRAKYLVVGGYAVML